MQMQRAEGEFEARGAALVAIGQGTGETTQSFCAKFQVGYPCLGNPDRGIYQAFGFRRGSWGDVMWKPLLGDPVKGIPRVFRADLAGARLPTSDVKQLGGVAIVSADGRIRYRYRQKTSGDLPEVAELLDALDRLAEQKSA